VKFESQKALFPVRASPPGICCGRRWYVSIHCIVSRLTFSRLYSVFLLSRIFARTVAADLISQLRSNVRWMLCTHSRAMTFSVVLIVTSSDSCRIHAVCSGATESERFVCAAAGQGRSCIVRGLLRKICYLARDNACFYLVNHQAFLELVSVNKRLCILSRHGSEKKWVPFSNWKWCSNYKHSCFVSRFLISIWKSIILTDF
jgi:hypothetical protein